jgi:hypothetical protein
MISTENSMIPPSANSRGGFCRPIVTLVSFVETVEIRVARFGTVSVTELLLVEMTVEVVVMPTAVTDVLVTLVVDVVELTTTVTPVTLVVTVDVLITVV